MSTTNLKSLSNIVEKSENIFQSKGAVKALKFIRKALLKFPNNPELLGNAGMFAASIKKNVLADDYFNQAIKLEKNNPNLYNNYGNFLKQVKRFSSAEIFYKKALDIEPESSDILSNIGNLCKTIGRYKEAKMYYEKSLHFQPNSPTTLFNFAKLLAEDFKDFEGAIVCYKKALKLRGSYADAKFNLSTLFLRLQRFKEGWSYYDTRCNLKERSCITPKIKVPEWSGDNSLGAVLFIWPEQGVGDEVMFASLLPQLKDINIKIILACDPRLVEIYARSFPFLKVIARDEDNEYKSLTSVFDYQIALGSLPKIYRNKLSDFKQHKPYLNVDSHLASKWKDRYINLKHKLNIGISWFGGPNSDIQKSKSISLDAWLPILKLPANFINLQYGDHSDEIKTLENKEYIHLHDWFDADPLKDLDNFAAQVSELDLIISVSNTTVHFAGALGVDTLVMLPFFADWRWSEDCNSSYWYPCSVRLYRQPCSGNWNEVIEAVAEEVSKKIKRTYY